MRFLVDECMSRRIVERLLTDGHDVTWAAEAYAGHSDDELLELSRQQSRVLLTEDWDFGDLAIRLQQPAFGVAIVAISQFMGDPEDFADRLAERLSALGEGLIGKLSVIEAGRVRQRGLTA